MNQDSLLYIYGVGLVVAVVVAFLLGQAAARRRAERAHLGASERAKKVEPGAQLPALDEKAAEGQDAVTIQKADASPMGATRASTASSVPWFSRLTLGLSKTQAQLVRQIESL